MAGCATAPLRRIGLVLAVLLCAACSAVLPAPETGIPITITNEDDEPAVIEVTLYNATTGRGRPANEPFELAPGETTTLRLEPTRGRDDAFHLIINGFVATSSEFLGCDIAELDPPLPERLDIVVLTNGEPRTCP